MRTGRGLAVLLVTLVAQLAGSRASAADPPIAIPARLEYAAPQGCPPESVLRAEFARRMGVDPFVESAPLRVVATVTREKNALKGSLALYDNEGKLIWSKPSTQPTWQCAALVREMAGSLAFRLDPKVYGPDPIDEPPPPPPAPTPEPRPEPAPVTVAPPAPTALVVPPTAPPKRALRFVAGLDGILSPLIAPSANAGFAVWAGIDLLDVPVSFELDLRSTWSLASAHVPLMHKPFLTVRDSYVAGDLVVCWRGQVSLCPILEVGRMSFSRTGTIGGALGPSILVAAGLRGMYARAIGEHFVVRGIFEVDGVLNPVSILDYTGPAASSPNPVSLTWGIGFGRFL